MMEVEVAKEVSPPKRPKIDHPIALLPIKSYSLGLSVDIKLDPLPSYCSYTPPFPCKNHTSSVNNFRVKVVKQQTVHIVYLAYWRPLSKHPKTAIKYKVLVYKKVASNSFFHDGSLEATCRPNEWIMIYQCKPEVDILRLEIRHVLIENLPPILEQPKPLEMLLDSSDYSIVKLMGKDSSCVEVMQCALESHSDVFKRMFDGDWREKTEKRIQLDDMCETALKEIKAYLYCSTIPTAAVSGVFAFANMYEMEHLKFGCAVEIYKQVTLSNAKDILKMALHYDYKPLISALLLYCEEHRFQLDI